MTKIVELTPRQVAEVKGAQRGTWGQHGGMIFTGVKG